MSNAGGCPFGIVMQADSLMEFFFFNGGCLGKMTGSKKEMVVVEMVVWMVGRVVLANLGVLIEVVILVQLMVRGWTWEMVVGVAVVVVVVVVVVVEEEEVILSLFSIITI